MTPEEKAAADKAAADKSAADRVAADKAAAHRDGAVEGARSVAEAVRRVADAAVAAVQNVQPAHTDREFQASGSAGGTFELNGPQGIFSSGGTVTLNGQQVHTTEWSTTRIVGRLPQGVKSGDIVVHIDDKTSRRGYLTL